MDLKKIGNFIRCLREEKNLNQEELANILLVHRTTVNKWEKGKSIPLNDTLLLLSEYFKVTIDEILAGERLKKNKNNNITIELLNKHFKFKKLLKISLLTLMTSIIVFLIYYFISTYNSIHVYTFSGKGEYYYLYDGLIVTSNNKTYIKFGNIENLNEKEDDIDQLEMYTIKSNKKTLIYSGDPETIVMENDTSKEIFNNIDLLKNKVIIKINKDEFELKIKKDFQNNNFFKKNKKTLSDNRKNDSIIVEIKNPEIFEYNEEENSYSLKENNYEIIYHKFDNTITSNYEIDNKQKRYLYSVDTNILLYKEYSNKVLIKEIQEFIDDNSMNSDYLFFKKYVLEPFFEIIE